MRDLFKKGQFFTMMLAVIGGLTPIVANAGIFDWFSGLKSNYVIEGLTVASSGSLYANAGFAQDTDNEVQGLPLIFQGNSLAQYGGLASITKSNRVNSISIKRVMRVVASAYSSTVDQTDADPFTTANGTRVRDGIIATNMLPFNTLVKIPDIYGDKIFTVTDRMNARYGNHIDIWFPDRQTALIFGRKPVNIEIVGSL